MRGTLTRGRRQRAYRKCCGPSHTHVQAHQLSMPLRRRATTSCASHLACHHRPWRARWSGVACLAESRRKRPACAWARQGGAVSRAGAASPRPRAREARLPETLHAQGSASAPHALAPGDKGVISVMRGGEGNGMRRTVVVRDEARWLTGMVLSSAVAGTMVGHWVPGREPPEASWACAGWDRGGKATRTG